MEENGSNGSKKVLLSVLGVAILVVAVVGISFAAFSATGNSEDNTISTGTILVSYQEPSAGINLENALPMSESEGLGLNNNSFEFTVSTKASGVVDIPYNISITPTVTEIPITAVRVALKKDGIQVQLKNANSVLINELDASSFTAGSKLLYTTTDKFTAAGQEQKDTKYVLQMWIDKDANVNEISDKTFKMLVNVDSTVNHLENN